MVTPSCVTNLLLTAVEIGGITAELVGTAPPTMNRHGAMRGRRRDTHGLTYDARL